MTNSALTQIDALISKAHDVVEALDNAYTIRVYTPELEPERGKYGFNILPKTSITREFSGVLSEPNLTIDVIMYYTKEMDEEYQPAWNSLMNRANDVLNALYDKQNFPDGVSTVTINITFDNPVIEKESLLMLIFICEYKIFATR